MQPILFTISPIYNGWQVHDELRCCDWYERLDDAVASAGNLAQLRHALTGQPTAVAVSTIDGEAAIRLRHG